MLSGIVLAQTGVPPATSAAAAAPAASGGLQWFAAGLAVGAMMLAAIWIATVAMRAFSRRGKALVAWVDGDSGGARLEWIARDGNEILLGKGQHAKRYLLEGRARLNAVLGMWSGAFWVIHRRHGWNLQEPEEVAPGESGFIARGKRGLKKLRDFTVLRVPTDAETVRVDAELEEASYSNPESYEHAIRVNEARDALEANREDNDWKGKLVVVILILGVLTILMLGYVIAKIASGAAPGAH